ncbi:MAG TPA: hypothetical protein VF950_21315 [Planctomycetota bacterium]
MNLLLALILQANPEALVRALGAENPEERIDAERRIKSLGAAALPALRAAAADANPELRARAARVLAAIEQVRAFRPSARKTTLRADKVPFQDAVERALGPYGFPRPAEEPQGVAATLKLDLKEAGFWDVVEALETASGLRYFAARSSWERETAPRARDGEVTLQGHSWGRNNLRQPVLFPNGYLSPGSWASSLKYEKVELLDAKGRVLPAKIVAGSSGAKRREGQPTLLKLPGLAVPPDALTGVETLELRCVLVLNFATDVDRAQTPLAPLPAVMEIDGAVVRLEKLDMPGPGQRYEYGVEGKGGASPLAYLITLEDEFGRWIMDLCHGTIAAKAPLKHNGGGLTAPPGKPARVAVIRAIGEEPLRATFSLKGIPPP